MRYAAHSLAVLALASLALVAWLAGPGTPGGTHAFASESPLIELRATAADAWSQSVPGVWSASNVGPGDAVTGSVFVRWTGARPEEGVPALRVTVSAGEPNPAALLVTGMWLGELDLSGEAAVACGGSSPCEVAVTAPLAPGGDGVLFTLTIVIDPQAGNVLQGATMEGLRITFEAAIGAVPTATPTPAVSPSPAGPSPTPSPAGTPTPGAAPQASPALTESPETTPIPAGTPAIPPGPTPDSSLPLPKPTNDVPTPPEPRPAEPTPAAIETSTPAPAPGGARPPWPPAAGSGAGRGWSPEPWALLAGAALSVLALVAWTTTGRRRQ